ARLKHETWTRSDALLQSDGTVPEAVGLRELPLGAYPAASQFSRAVFETTAEVIVLSIQPDVGIGLVKHRQEGFLLYASEAENWSAADKQWLKSDFEPLGSLAVAESLANLTAVIKAIRERSGAPI